MMKSKIFRAKINICLHNNNNNNNNNCNNNNNNNNNNNMQVKSSKQGENSCNGTKVFFPDREVFKIERLKQREKIEVCLMECSRNQGIGWRQRDAFNRGQLKDRIYNIMKDYPACWKFKQAAGMVNMVGWRRNSGDLVFFKYFLFLKWETPDLEISRFPFLAHFLLMEC